MTPVYEMIVAYLAAFGLISLLFVCLRGPDVAGAQWVVLPVENAEALERMIPRLACRCARRRLWIVAEENDLGAQAIRAVRHVGVPYRVLRPEEFFDRISGYMYEGQPF